MLGDNRSRFLLEPGNQYSQEAMRNGVVKTSAFNSEKQSQRYSRQRVKKYVNNDW